MAKNKNKFIDISLSLLRENDIAETEADDPLNIPDTYHPENNSFSFNSEQKTFISEIPEEKIEVNISESQTIKNEIKSRTQTKFKRKKRKTKKCYLTQKSTNISNDLKSFNCMECNLQFESLNKLNSHSNTEHLDKLRNDEKRTKKSLCHLCGKIFNYVSQYHEHLLMHENIKNYICGICKKGFASKRILTIHEKIHDSMENRKYICGHIFDDNEPITINTNAPSLQYVITNSDGQKVCNFGCVSKSDLRKHRLIHSNVKPFSCNFCPMSFRQTGHLRRHIKRHTGKRDFICNICSVGFVTKDNLKNHLPIHENVLPYICEHCGKTLLQRSQCVRHVAKCSMLQVKNSDVDNKSDKVNEKD